MEIGAKTDIGKTRDNNQDAYYISQEGDNFLFVIADGMGGHKAGETASNMAVDIIGDSLNILLTKSNLSEKEIEDKIKASIHDANSRIYKKSMKDERFSGMGTTVTLAYIKDKDIFIGHAGDSRAYILRNNVLVQVTKDHSLVEELIRNGSISEEEAKHHPQRNVITRAVGSSSEINTDLIKEYKNHGDILLLCTDGLTSMLNDDEIKNSLLSNESMQKACEDLVRLSNDKGGFDNITILAVKF